MHHAKLAPRVVKSGNPHDRSRRLRRGWSGVDRAAPPPPHTATESTAVSAPLIAEESRSHHFGAVISKSGLKLKHAYRLVNTTKHDIKVVDLVNLKPCCGEVRIGKTILHPGDETKVEVALSIRQEFGEIVHGTQVLTEPPQPDDLVLRTMATAYPPIRLEETSPGGVPVLLSSDHRRRLEFRVFASGSSSEPPCDLDCVALRLTIKVEWAGPKEVVPSDDGLRVESRRFGALLDPTGPRGERRAEIRLLNGSHALYGHIVSWEVVSPIGVSPKLVVIQPGKQDYRVLIESRDQKLFRVTGVECKVRGVQGRARDAAAAFTHTVEIENRGVAPPEGGRGVITVFTDHPFQAKVDLPFVVIE